VDAARVIGPALLDNSAWARLDHPRLDRARADEIAAAAENLRLVVTLPFLLEAGYSARNVAQHREVMAWLRAMPRFEIDRDVEERALGAQGQLAAVGHHRVPPSDVLIAAIADRRGSGVLHYDHHYDVIAERTDLEFDSVWLAEPGSLD
jgi:predicted nucleic acid-binding protein